MKDLCKKTSTFLNVTIRDQLDDFGLLVLRLFFGGAMITHGWQKFANFEAMSQQFPDLLHLGSPALNLGLCIFAELVCGILLVIGLMGRFAAAVLTFNMLIAAFIAHGADPFEKKELALAYLAAYFVLVLRGSGKLSLDGVFCKS